MWNLSRFSLIILTTNIPVIAYTTNSSVSTANAVFWLAISIGLVVYSRKQRTEYENLHHKFNSFAKDIKPYLGDVTANGKNSPAYKQYLTFYERRRLLHKKESLQAELDKVDSKIPVIGRIFVFVNPGSCRNYYTTLLTKVNWLINNWQQYNKEFVERQLDRDIESLDLIGGEDYSLDPAQRRAVVRNDTYNKIIASAGAGKTSVLVAKVSYLINNRGIDPQRILVFSYTNKACDEIRCRLDDLGIHNVTVQTIHSFGYSVTCPTGSALDLMDINDIENFVNQQIRDQSQTEHGAFWEHYSEFLSWINSDDPTEAEFADKEAYLEARQDSWYTTLDGKQVASKDEKMIADFLFRNGITYEYESYAGWADTSSGKNKYNVDFYLPDDEVYVEHWGIDKSGEVADWFTQSTEEYHKKIYWARKQFSDYDESLVETYHFEYNSGNLKRALRGRLSDCGVEFDRLGYQDLVEKVFEDNNQEQWIVDQFQKYIVNAKTFEIYPQEIEAGLDIEHRRHYHFNKCGIFLLKKYQLYLTEHDLVDFPDLLYDALSEIKDKQQEYLTKYDHVFVDEFQDIGAGQRQLIDALTGPTHPEIGDVKLSAVGDDWQSIYSFQGAVMDYFVDFEDYYGPNAKSVLKNNYRNPSTVVDASMHVIDQNSKKSDKIVNSQSGIDTTPRIHRLHSNNWYGYISLTATRAADLCVGYLNETESDPEDIMILCRYDDAIPILGKIRKTLRDRGIPHTGKGIQYTPSETKKHPDVGSMTGDGVSVYSIHQSKGREANHVIFAHVATGPVGFPYENEGRDLLDLVRKTDSQDIEEERRLFYVGITRSGGTLDILTRSGSESIFIEEINDYCIEAKRESINQYDRPTSVTFEVRVKHLFETANNKMSQSGIIECSGDSVRFVTWARHDPPKVEEEEWYRFEHFRLREFRGELQLQYTNSSTIEHLPDKYGMFPPASVEQM